jgi:ornithine carbamoyltransferase
MRHFLTLFDLSANELAQLLETAVDLKTKLKAGLREPLFAGHMIGLLFEKQSLRTRVSFEAAIAHLGGNALYLGTDAGWGKRESLEDFSRVLTSYVDAVVYRGKDHGLLEQFAAHANCPVINGLTNTSHPCQAMGDLLTLREVRGELAGQKVVFVGDGNNVAHSLALGCAMVGAKFVLATPDEYQLAESYLATILAAYPHAQIEQSSDPHAAVAGADAIYTDVWASMGQEAETAARKKAFAPYQVNADLMSAAGEQALFMHCLPAKRGEEVTDEVIDSAASVVVQQAENRMHAQKAILVWLFNHR